MTATATQSTSKRSDDDDNGEEMDTIPSQGVRSVDFFGNQPAGSRLLGSNDHGRGLPLLCGTPGYPCILTHE